MEQNTPVCDSCCALPATLYCKNHSARLCSRCDQLVHGTDQWHERCWICDHCMAQPSSVYCINDQTVLCMDCDTMMHPIGDVRRVRLLGFSWSPTMDDAITEGHVLSLVPNPQDVADWARSLASSGAGLGGLGAGVAIKEEDTPTAASAADPGWFASEAPGAEEAARCPTSDPIGPAGPTPGPKAEGAAEELVAAVGGERSEARSDDSSCTRDSGQGEGAEPGPGPGSGPGLAGERAAGGVDVGESWAATSQLVGGAPLPPYAPTSGAILRGSTDGFLPGAAPSWQLSLADGGEGPLRLAPPGKLLYFPPGSQGPDAPRDAPGGAAVTERTLSPASTPRAGGGSKEEEGVPGRCGPEERQGILAKFRAKRERRGKAPQVRYKARQVRAGGRVRIQGRFASAAEMAEMARAAEREEAEAAAAREADAMLCGV